MPSIAHRPVIAMPCHIAFSLYSVIAQGKYKRPGNRNKRFHKPDDKKTTKSRQNNGRAHTRRNHLTRSEKNQYTVQDNANEAARH